ncbi:hypothetical protein SNE40_010053 [Patella caerulea]|uniref:Uncharacterized protein n=1 Tax=Patella caerulea TaxID=87958 RepID=A0AAN8JZY7_PATCE
MYNASIEIFMYISEIQSYTVVFSVLGFMSHKTGSLVEDIVNTVPGLAFITYPEALSRLPLPQLWAVLFFLMLLFVSIDSMFVSVEVVITTLTDLIPNLTSKTRLMVTASTCFLMCLSGNILTGFVSQFETQTSDFANQIHI